MRATLLSLSCVMYLACSFDTSGVPAGNDGPIPIDGPPGVDGPPSVDGPPGVDAPPPICTAGEVRCMGMDLETCNGTGTAWDVTQTCDLGCDDVNLPAHCDDVVPSNNIPTGALYQGTAVLTSMNVGGYIFFTDTGEIQQAGGQPIRAAGGGLISNIYFQTVPQAGGPTIGVFSMGSLELLSGHNLRGIGANALAIATSGTITINGVIDLTGGQVACPADPLANRCAGPGGSQGADSQMAAAGNGAGGGGTGGGGATGESGGGGGGHGGVGGAGGASSAAGGTGGTADGLIDLQPLTGGGGGGGGGNEGGAKGGVGGGGGGAVQLISHVSITIDANAPCGINAGGAGAGVSGSGAGGGGGGAGGGILLEAPSVILGSNCVLAANGGSGSASDGGDAGNPGGLNDQRAAGGGNGTVSGGDGAGGSNLDGDAGATSGAEAGGGGGGAGIIRVNTQGGTNFTTDGTLSPTAGTGRATEGTLTIE